MDDIESKLGAILSDPDMMQKIMSIAQNFHTSDATPQPAPQQPDAPPLELDRTMLQKLSGFAQQSGIDKNQHSLLQALGPYLSHQRIIKLEKAMRAAKMANMASVFLSNAGR